MAVKVRKAKAHREGAKFREGSRRKLVGLGAELPPSGRRLGSDPKAFFAHLRVLRAFAVCSCF
jgi:hypothetical protein